MKIKMKWVYLNTAHLTQKKKKRENITQKTVGDGTAVPYKFNKSTNVTYDCILKNFSR